MGLQFFLYEEFKQNVHELKFFETSYLTWLKIFILIFSQSKHFFIVYIISQNFYDGLKKEVSNRLPKLVSFQYVRRKIYQFISFMLWTFNWLYTIIRTIELCNYYFYGRAKRGSDYILFYLFQTSYGVDRWQLCIIRLARDSGLSLYSNPWAVSTIGHI